MEIITVTVIVLVFLVIGITALLYKFSKELSREDRSYWEGRAKGWQACENLIMERSKKRGTWEKDWPELLR